MILILGATGKIGSVLLTQAVAAGQTVRVYVRNPAKLPPLSPSVEIVSGELTDEERVKGALRGVDAVLCAVGPAVGKKAPPVNQGIATVLACMRAVGVRRFVTVGLPSTHCASDKWSMRQGFAKTVIQMFAGQARTDMNRIADAVLRSGLDWTIVRFYNVTGSVRKPVRVNGSSNISPQSIADFMLTQVADRTYLGAMPFIGS